LLSTNADRDGGVPPSQMLGLFMFVGELICGQSQLGELTFNILMQPFELAVIVIFVSIGMLMIVFPEIVPELLVAVPNETEKLTLYDVNEGSQLIDIRLKTGVSLIVIVTESMALHVLLSVTVIIYVPASLVVALGITGFCNVLTNEFGPVQFHETPLFTVRFILSPLHIGLLLPAVAWGLACTVIVTESMALHILLSVTVIIYVPASLVVALGITGFCNVLTNEFGPVQFHETPLFTVRFILSPLHIGLLLPAVAWGLACTVIGIDPVKTLFNASVTVME
jgi:hypothetical protein